MMLFNLTRRQLLAGLAVAGTLAPAAAVAKPDLSALTDVQRRVLDKVNAAFDAIRTMDGKFTQQAPDGTLSSGVFVLSRPGKVLFRYNAPVQMEIRADGRSVVIDDMQRKMQTIAFLSDTPLSYILADRVDLAASNIVKSVTAGNGVVRVLLAQDGAFAQGQLTLVFDAKTIELKKWVATDAQGYDTVVALYDTRVGVPVDDSMFHIESNKYNKK